MVRTEPRTLVTLLQPVANDTSAMIVLRIDLEATRGHLAGALVSA
jgi:hypothetical protein